MDIVETAIWAGVVLVLGLVGAWRARQLWQDYLQQQERIRLAELPQKELDLRERTLNVELAENTADETARLRQSELRLQTTEAEDKAILLEATYEDRLAAERQVLAAQADAKASLAGEFARSEHEANLKSTPTADDSVVELWQDHLEAASEYDRTPLDFEDFVKLMASHGLVR